ncbi:MAG: hypothetical protein WEB63_05625 [Cucumibacter sp.]
MNDALDALVPLATGLAPERLNQSCLCVTLDRNVLGRALDGAAGEPGFFKTLAEQRPNLFSNVPVFLRGSVLDEMRDIVAAIEATSQLPLYRDAVLSWAPEISRQDHGPSGALMGYDFHLDDDGPKLIEVNTNAGGAFLNAVLAGAQKACCADVAGRLAGRLIEDFETQIVAMFLEEWRRQRGSGSPGAIAIVDDAPLEQYLYPEFVLARQMLARHGMDTFIGDARELQYQGNELFLDGRRIDLVYNRLVDFTLAQSEHAALRAAYRDDGVVVTPNPHHHALLANKRNLTLFSDPVALSAFGLPSPMRKRLAGIPRTRLVTPENSDELWQSRKDLFFKPVSGHGSKAVYRGDKLTRGVWANIACGDYVAQTFAAPGQRMITLEGEKARRKVDIRLYTYTAQPLLVAARLYQGQTTNFRTPGGGFAPVLVV